MATASTDRFKEEFEKAFRAHMGEADAGDPAVAATAAAAIEVETESLEGDTMLSGILKDNGYDVSLPYDVPVCVYERDSWGELTAGARFEDADTFKGYRPNGDHIAQLALECYLKGKVLMVGPPGTGKTSLAKFWGMLTNHPVVRINGDPSVEKADIIGERLLEGGQTVWVDGTLTQALRAGYLVIEDEIYRNQPPVLMCQQALFERGGYLRMLGKHESDVLYPDPRCFIVATDNTKGTGDGADKYVSMVHDTSLLNRIECTIEVDYLPAKEEVLVLKDKFDGVDPKLLSSLVKLAGEARVGYLKGELSLVMSLRNLDVVCERLRYIGVKPALRYGYANSLPADEVGKFAELYRKVFGEKF